MVTEASLDELNENIRVVKLAGQLVLSLNGAISYATELWMDADFINDLKAKRDRAEGIGENYKSFIGDILGIE